MMGTRIYIVSGAAALLMLAGCQSALADQPAQAVTATAGNGGYVTVYVPSAATEAQENSAQEAAYEVSPQTANNSGNDRQAAQSSAWQGITSHAHN